MLIVAATHHPLLRCLIVCWTVLLSAFISTAEEAPSTETLTATTDQLNSNSSSEDSAQRQRERAATVAVVLLAGIICIGVLLLAFILLWGRRTRRIARQQPSKPTTVDEMWYLKPGKQNASPSAADSDNNDKTKD